MHRISTYIRRNHLAVVALFFAVGGGAAYAADTVASQDIIDGEVKAADVASGGVRTAEIANGHVRGPDIAADAVASSAIADNAVGGPEQFLLAEDEIADNSVDGQDVDEASLDLDLEKAYQESDDDSRSYKTANAECPDGKRVIGAGGEINGAHIGIWPNVRTEVAITGIVPYGAQVHVGAAEIGGGTEADWQLVAFAICARIGG
jgi:hypothetical protein